MGQILTALVTMFGVLLGGAIQSFGFYEAGKSNQKDKDKADADEAALANVVTSQNAAAAFNNLPVTQQLKWMRDNGYLLHAQPVSGT